MMRRLGIFASIACGLLVAVVGLQAVIAMRSGNNRASLTRMSDVTRDDSPRIHDPARPGCTAPTPGQEYPMSVRHARNDRVQEFLTEMCRLDSNRYEDYERCVLRLEEELRNNPEAVSQLAPVMESRETRIECKLFLAGLIGLFGDDQVRRRVFKAVDGMGDERSLTAAIAMVATDRTGPGATLEDRPLFWKAWLYGVSAPPGLNGDPELLREFQRDVVRAGALNADFASTLSFFFQRSICKEGISDDPLLEYVVDRADAWTAEILATVISRLGPSPRMYAQVEDWLWDPSRDPRVRRAAFNYLLRYDESRSLSLIFVEQDADLLQRMLSDSSSGRSQELDRLLLARYGVESSSRVRRSLISTLLARGTPMSCECLIAIVRDEPNEDTLKGLAVQLHHLGRSADDRVLQIPRVGILRQLVVSGSAAVRSEAVKSASYYGVTEARDLLIWASLNDPDLQIRNLSRDLADAWRGNLRE